MPIKKAGGGEVEAQQVPYSGGEYPGEVETPAWYDKATQVERMIRDAARYLPAIADSKFVCAIELGYGQITLLS